MKYLYRKKFFSHFRNNNKRNLILEIEKKGFSS